jgi:hypothetical protein
MNNQLTLSQFVTVASLDVVDVPNDSGLNFAFQIFTPKKSFKVVAQSQEEKIDWMLDIVKAIEEEKRKKESFRKSGRQQIEQNAFVAPVCTFCLFFVYLILFV